MTQSYYLFDTHALIFWDNQDSVSDKFIKFFDEQVQSGFVYVSSISFWETALLVQTKKLTISDIHGWKNQLMENTNLHILDPNATEMIDATLLPHHHKDPFDRVLIAQANANDLMLVTRDDKIKRYDVKTFWI